MQTEYVNGHRCAQYGTFHSLLPPPPSPICRGLLTRLRLKTSVNFSEHRRRDAVLLGTLNNTTPSTERGGQFFQLISLSPGNTYEIERIGHHVVLKESSCLLSLK